MATEDVAHRLIGQLMAEIRQGTDDPIITPLRPLREQHRQDFVGCYATMRRSSMSVNMSWRTAS